MSINRRGFLGKLGLGAAVAAIPTALLARPKSEVIETDQYDFHPVGMPHTMGHNVRVRARYYGALTEALLVKSIHDLDRHHGARMVACYVSPSGMRDVRAFVVADRRYSVGLSSGRDVMDRIHIAVAGSQCEIETDHGLAQNEYVMLGHRGFTAGHA